MPTIPTIGGTNAPTGITDATQNTLGKDDFLKLLVGQLKNQNPLNPTNDTEFIAQMAQFSQLEQTTNMARENADMAAQQRDGRAIGLIGKTVTYPTSETTTATGVVSAVTWVDGAPQLTVDGQPGVDPAAVTTVQ